jgi:hypothetical protein
MKEISPFIDALSRIHASSSFSFDLLLPDDGDACVDISGAPGLFETQGIFDSCSDEDARILLADFVLRKTECGHDLGCELAKLLASRGCLVKELIEPIIQEQDWSVFSAHFFLLSYVVNVDDRERWMTRLLDIVPEDFRDGIFLACFRADSPKIDAVLMDKFAEWDRDASWTPTATGELGALGFFLKRWMQKYSMDKLHVPVSIYFRHL